MVVRHASAKPQGETDHARPLSTGGSAEAAELGRLMARAGLRPDHALVSDAVRAQQTWSALERESGGSCPAVIEPALYSASAEVVLDELRLVPADTGTVVYVGHNPAAEYIAAVLSDGDGDADEVRELLRGMPPATAAVFGLECKWDQLAPGCARLLRVLRPAR